MSLGDLTDNFSRHEFACECGCGLDDIDTELVELLQKIRNHFEKRMDVNSGCRCWPHHVSIYKKMDPPQEPTQNSYHLGKQGCKAADVVVKDVSPQLVAEAAILYGATGVKNYSTFTHIDTRAGKEWIKVT